MNVENVRNDGVISLSLEMSGQTRRSVSEFSRSKFIDCFLYFPVMQRFAIVQHYGILQIFEKGEIIPYQSFRPFFVYYAKLIRNEFGENPRQNTCHFVHSNF